MSFFEEFANSAGTDRHLLLRKNDIELYEFAHYRYVCSGDRVIQGAMDVLAPSSVQSPVVDAMLAGLHLSRQQESVLNLGLGCAAIERYLDARHPSTFVVTVDCSQDVIELCSAAELLPEGCVPVLSDAAQYLKQTSNRFNAVFCDLAVGQNQDQMLRTESFYRACLRCMTPGAVLMVNVLCSDNEALSKVCLAARKVFAWTAVCDIPGFDNVVLYASDTPPAIELTHDNGEHETELLTSLSRIRILP